MVNGKPSVVKDSNGFGIRPYQSTDLSELYRICLQTGDNGNDATGLFDKDLLGHIFAAPYAISEPKHTHLLTLNEQVCGYILGMANTSTFVDYCEASWWPTLRLQYARPDPEDESTESQLVSIIHNGLKCPTFVDQFPAHLHIDILPIGQGKKLGSRLIDHFCECLAAEDIRGVHLSVGKANVRASAFYLKTGFEVIDESANELIYAKRL
ncbi:MAG: hypothetical protein JKY88_16100 [Pseudomonadales bacterium]|nr:hypothetical protein [Pseudomonadales bacterium]